MEIKNILTQDSNGQLTTDPFKLDLTAPAAGIYFDANEPNTRILKFSPNNVDFNAIPNLNPASYISFVAYNGTLGYSNRVFSSVVATDSGPFYPAYDVPVTTYNPNTVESVTDAATLQDVVIEISMFNGTVDVLNYSEGYLNAGNKDYVVKSRRAFPTVIHNLPNIGHKQVYLDGWYTYTFIVFRDLEEGDTVYKDNFYAAGGFIFQASKDGLYGEDTGGHYILDVNNHTAKIYQLENNDYESILFFLNNNSEIGGDGGYTFLHSQVLVTDTLRDAIVAEALDIACGNETGCDFMDWQKLSAKRIGAAVMFENGLYEKSQTILESARTMCLNKKIDLSNNS